MSCSRPRLVRIGFRELAGMIACLGLAVAAAAANDEPGHPAPCRDISLPVSIVVEVDELPVARGPAFVTVSVTALADLADVRVRSRHDGLVEVLAPLEESSPVLAAEQTVTYLVPILYLGVGVSAVHIDVDAVIDRLDYPFSTHNTLNTLMRLDDAFAGPDDPFNLARHAIDHDLALARIAPMEAAARLRRLTGVAAVATTAASPFSGSTGTDDLSTNVTVQGTVQYTDELGGLHPVFGMTVEIRDDDGGVSDLIATTTTDVAGTFSETFDFADPGGPDVFARFITENGYVQVRMLGGAAYPPDNGPITHDVSDNAVVTANMTYTNTTVGTRAGVLSGMTFIATYAEGLNGGVALPPIPVEFPGLNGSFYAGTRINIAPDSGTDWDVLHHEYGHYVQDTFDFEDSPGGPHVLGACVAVMHGDKSRGVRLAWGEGWPTFFGTTGQSELGLGPVQALRVGDAFYTNGGLEYSLEASNALGFGEDNELAVQRVLWDLYDGPADDRDTLTIDDQTLFDAVTGSGVETMSEAWALLRAAVFLPDNDIDIAAGAIASDHLIGPEPTTPADGELLTPGTGGFAWDPNVGCHESFEGDDFTVRFFNPDTHAEITSVVVSGDPVMMLTGTLFDQLALSVGNDGTVLFAVEGSNTAPPQTGPFLGAPITININSPPDARVTPEDAPPVTTTD